MENYKAFFFFIVHVQGKRVKEEENLCQITAAIRMNCKMYTYIRPMKKYALFERDNV